MRKYRTSLYLGLCLAFCLIPVWMTTVDLDEQIASSTPNQISGEPAASLTLTSPIHITQNSDITSLPAESWTYISASNYLIHDIEVDAMQNDYGVFVDNYAGTVQFQNVTVYNVSDVPRASGDPLWFNYTNAGFHILNTNNVQIRECLVYNTYFGILVNNSDTVRISETEITDCISIGIYTVDSNALNIQYNQIHDNEFKAVVINDGANSDFKHNSIFDNELSGIEANFQENLEIENNTVNHNGGTGIVVYGGDNNIIDSNNASENMQGIITSEGDNIITVLDNICNDNENSGIEVHNIIDADITGNEANFNGGTGILVSGNIIPSFATHTFESTGTFILPNPNAYTIKTPSLVRFINQTGYSGYELNITTTDNTPDSGWVYFSGSALTLNASNVTGLSGPFNSLTDLLYVEYNFQQDAYIYQNDAYGNGVNGLAVIQCNSTTIQSNDLWLNGNTGLLVENGGDNYVTSNIIANNTNYGVMIIQEDDTELYGNTILENYGYGISIEDSWSTYINANDINMNFKSGIIIDSNDVWIHNGQIDDNLQYGVEINGDSNQIIGGIDIKRNLNGGVLVNGNGNQIESLCEISENYGNGITVLGINNIIDNNRINNNLGHGISIEGQDHLITSNTQLNNNGLAAIYLGTSQNIEITGNIMLNSGIFLEGDSLTHMLSHTISTTNTLNGQNVYFYKSTTGTIAPTSGQIIAVDCDQLSVSSKTIGLGANAIGLYYCNEATLEDLTLINHTIAAIFVFESDNSIIDSCVIDNVTYGIQVLGDLTSIQDTDISNASNAAIIIEGDYNIITDCFIETCIYDGIDIIGGHNLVNNTDIYDCDQIGVYMTGEINTLMWSTIDNSGSHGVLLENHLEGIVQYNHISDVNFGSLYILESNQTQIKHNIISNTVDNGVIINNSLSLSFINNSITGYGLQIFGDSLEYYRSHTFELNRRNGLLLAYLVDKVQVPLSSYCSQMILVNCNQTTVENLNINGASIALQLYYSNNNQFIGIPIATTLSNSLFANVYMEYSNGNHFKRMNFDGSEHGILQIASNNTIFEDIQFSNNIQGLNIEDSQDVSVSNCNFEDNTYSMMLINSQRCYIQENNFENSLVEALNIQDSELNYIENNVFTEFGTSAITLVKCENNFFTNNLFKEASVTPLKLLDSSENYFITQQFRNLTNTPAIYIDEDSTYNTIDRVDIIFSVTTTNTHGIVIAGSYNYILQGSITNAYHGIWIDGGFENFVEIVLISKVFNGIYLSNMSFSNAIEKSTIKNCTNAGISIREDSEDVLIMENQISSCLYGVNIEESDYVNISFNYFCSNNFNIRSISSHYVSEFLNLNCFIGDDNDDNVDDLIDTTDTNNIEGTPSVIDEIPGYPTGIILILGLCTISIGILRIRKRSN